MTRIKAIVLIIGLLVCGSLGVVAAVAWSPEGSVAEGAVERVRHGVTETGRVEVVKKYSPYICMACQRKFPSA